MSNHEMTFEEAEEIALTPEEMELAMNMESEDSKKVDQNEFNENAEKKIKKLAKDLETEITKNAENKALEKIDPKPKPKPIEAFESGMLVGKTLEDQWRLATAYCKSGMLPKHFNTPEKVLTLMQFSYELGVKPLTGARQMMIVNGAPSIYGDLPLSIVYSKNMLEWIDEYYIDSSRKRIDPDGENATSEIFGAICITKRKGDEILRKTSFTFDDAKRANLYPANKLDSAWKKYPFRMLQMRARTVNLKDKFPDALNGIAIAEYDYNVMPGEAKVIDGITHEGKAERVTEMNKKFGG